METFVERELESVQIARQRNVDQPSTPQTAEAAAGYGPAACELRSTALACFAVPVSIAASWHNIQIGRSYMQVYIELYRRYRLARSTGTCRSTGPVYSATRGPLYLLIGVFRE